MLINICIDRIIWTFFFDLVSHYFVAYMFNKVFNNKFNALCRIEILCLMFVNEFFVTAQ